MKKAFVLVGLLLAISWVFAEFPKEMNFQGKLEVGTPPVPVSGYRNITLKIYDVEPVGTGTPLWTQNYPTVSVTGGLFNVIMTGLNSLPFDKSYWVELLDITGGVTLSPRYKLTATPYAFRSEYVDSAINYVNSTASPARRTGGLTFAPGSSSSLYDYGDSIKIIVDGGSSSTSNACDFFDGDTNSFTGTGYVDDLCTVPAGGLYLYGTTLSAIGDDAAGVVSLAYNVSTTYTPIATISVNIGSEESMTTNFNPPIFLAGGTVLKIWGHRYLGSADQAIHSAVTIWGKLGS